MSLVYDCSTPQEASLFRYGHHRIAHWIRESERFRATVDRLSRLSVAPRMNAHGEHNDGGADSASYGTANDGP